MSKKKKPSVPSPDVFARQKGGNRRTLKDKLLIFAWVAAYAGMLVAFRVTRMFENAKTQKRGGSAEARGKQKEEGSQVG